MVTFQDRLRGHETDDELWDETEEIITEMVTEHFDRAYDGEVCEACLKKNQIPIDHTRGLLSGMAEEVENLAGFVRDRFDELGQESEWVMAEIRGRYHDSYYEMTVDPIDCAVCTAEVVDEDTPCGHWEEYQACPVRGEPE